jgi:hypothetical protein
LSVTQAGDDEEDVDAIDLTHITAPEKYSDVNLFLASPDMSD